MKRRRLDLVMVERGLAESREKARVAILAGGVLIDGHLMTKPAASVVDGAGITLVTRQRYVSRGGNKLEHALDSFELEIAGTTAMDVGASTGGFTDCLLQRGANRVYSIDVGYGQLDYRLRQDARVVSMERTHIKEVTELAERPDLAVIDVSFIGLENVLPSVTRLLKPGGRVVALIKPQFQAKRGEVRKGGVVRDPLVHATVIGRVIAWSADSGLRFGGLTTSPLKGPAGNREFFAIWATK